MKALYDLPAPAKLNLFLHVVGKRADGYHLLQSLFVLIDWADTLHFERRSDGLLRRHDLGAELPADDLCLRAARLLQAESGSTLGADIHIDKRVPWGAGLGGGSSDAATTLMALNRLWGLHWPRVRLLALGARLGADVPFFIGGTAAFVQGIGEQLSPVELPPQGFAVLKPPQPLATRDIFSSPLMVVRPEAAILSGSFADTATVEQWCSGWGRNDLQAAAEAQCPQVRQVAQWLEGRYGNSRMTGSGSAVFARVGSGAPPEATWLDGALPEALPEGWVGRLCRSLQRHPLAGWQD